MKTERQTGLNWLLIAVVRAYRYLLSPWLGSACRFTPTCSEYAMRALQSHGTVTGVCLSVSRIARCHPWCAGGPDPVPTLPPKWTSAYSLFARRCFKRIRRTQRSPSQ